MKKNRIVGVIMSTVITMVCFVQVFLFTGCRNKKIPYTLKDVERFTREKFFDEDGNAVLWYWETAMTNWSEESKIKPLNITGFSCSLIKDVLTGKETGYFVEFEETGYLCGNFGQEYFSGNFMPGKSPFKRMGIEQEKRYAVLVKGTPFLGIEKDGLILNYYTYEAMEKNDMQVGFRAYDPKNKEWIQCETIEQWLKSKEN